MIDLEYLKGIKEVLENLSFSYYCAYRTRDGRRREKAIREARNAIASYSRTIPFDLMEVYNSKVGANALNFQHADDISECIDILDKMIKEEECKLT